MDDIETTLVIEEIRSGKVFHKLLPFAGTRHGGTFICYDPARDIFVEEYVNEFYEERCPSYRFSTERNETDTRKMFLKKDYTDKRYSTMGSFEEYEFIEKEEAALLSRAPGTSFDSLHPNDRRSAKCPKCKSLKVTITHYNYTINPATGDRYVSLSFVCDKCGETVSNSWDD